MTGKPTRGGKRPRAGRPRSAPLGSKRVSLYMTDDERREVVALLKEIRGRIETPVHRK